MSLSLNDITPKIDGMHVRDMTIAELKDCHRRNMNMATIFEAAGNHDGAGAYWRRSADAVEEIMRKEGRY